MGSALKGGAPPRGGGTGDSQLNEVDSSASENVPGRERTPTNLIQYTTAAPLKGSPGPPRPEAAQHPTGRHRAEATASSPHALTPTRQLLSHDQTLLVRRGRRNLVHRGANARRCSHCGKQELFPRHPRLCSPPSEHSPRREGPSGVRAPCSLWPSVHGGRDGQVHGPVAPGPSRGGQARRT